MIFFLISKPTQYLTVLALREQLNVEMATLLVVEKFSGSEDFIRRIRLSGFWDKVISAKTRIRLFVKKRLMTGAGGALYTDSDIFLSGVLNKLPFIFSCYSVFDEGFYSYISDVSPHLKTQNKSLKLMLYKLLSLNISHGHNKSVDLYLYKPLARLDRGSITICDGILCTVKKHWMHIVDVYSVDMTYVDSVIRKLGEGEVRIYCSSHNGARLNDQEFIESMDLIKLHPIMTEDASLKVLDSWVPIEIIIEYIVRQGLVVKLYHEGSSIMLHLAPLIEGGRIKDINLGTYAKEFSQVYQTVISNIKG
jgi:hypothetical protein